MHAYMCVPLYLCVPVCVPLSFSLHMCVCVYMHVCVHAHVCMHAVCLCGVGWSRSWGQVGIELQVFLMSALLLNSVLPVVIFFFKCKSSRTKTNDKNMSSSGL